MRRCRTLLGLATSLVALLAVAIGPAPAAAGTPQAHPQTASPHVAVTRPPTRCSAWTPVGGQRNYLQARACITYLEGTFPTAAVSAWVRNRTRVPRVVSVHVSLLHGGSHNGGGREVEVEECEFMTVRSAETRGCGGQWRVGLLHRPYHTRAFVRDEHTESTVTIFSPGIH